MIINSMKDVLSKVLDSKLFRECMIVFLTILCTCIFMTLFQHIYALNDKLNESYSIDIVLLKGVILIPVIFLIYYGFILALKIIIVEIEHYTKKHIIKNEVIICAAVGCSIIVIICTYIADPNTNKAKLGILFEIIGFIIYLTPVTKYLSKVTKYVSEVTKYWSKVVTDTEDKINNDLIVKTSAVIFVISGLFLQLLYS